MRLCLLILLCMPLRASNIYFDLASAGANSGTSCANARAYSSMSSSDWSAGNTLHICGTGTAGTNATPISSQASGSSGNPVTLLFETGAILAAQYCSGNGCVHLTHNFITVDGGMNGTIKNTANGTSRTNQQPSNLLTSAGTNIIIKNLTLADAYVYTGTSDESGNITSTGGIVFNSAQHVLVTNNVLHDAYGTIFFNGQSSDTDITVSNNTISAANWAIACGQCQAVTFLVDRNDISSASFEDGADNFHHNGVFVFNDTGQSVTGLVISNNNIHAIGGHETGHIFLDPSGSGNMPNCQIYNNLLTGGSPTNAYVTVGIGVSGCIIANNTISGVGAQGLSGQVSPSYKNNIIASMVTGISLNSGSSGVASDYNVFFGLTGGSSGQAMTSGSTNYSTVATWVSGTGFDTHSQTGDPKLNPDFTIQSGSSAIGNGTNLTSIGIAGLNVDRSGVARPSSGPWDVGAYQFASAPSISSFSGTWKGTFK